MRPIHSLCSPTSEIRMSSRPSALRISYERARRLHREGVVVLGLLEAAQHHVAQPGRAALVRHVPALLAEPA